MKQAVSFEFTQYTLDDKSGKLDFLYRIYFDDSSYQDFNERITLPGPISQSERHIIEQLMPHLHLMLGISYYKLYCPSEIMIKTSSLSKKQSEFWNTVYTKGLGEFFYKNKIDFRGLVNFPFIDTDIIPVKTGIYSNRSPIRSGMTSTSLVPFGGGKDSIVTAELLRKEGTQFSLFTLNPHPLQTEIIEKIGAEEISIKRELDPKLFELNKTASVYNGHIPITAIYSFITLLVAQLYGFDQIVMSNEKSANYGNVEYNGQSINHQWSKSEEFEELFAAYIRENITLEIHYYSRLRSFYEIEVVRQFASMPHYFSLFSSCNSNFKINQTSAKKWCGKCPKCAFVFACLSAFIEKDQLLKIFQKNLYEDESLKPLYRQLLGLADVKPFECVGTPEETQISLYMAYQRGIYNDTPVLKMFAKEVMPIIKNIESLKNKVLTESKYENKPISYKKIVTT